MTQTDERDGPNVTTGADDYGEFYYSHYNGPAYDPYSEEWRRFFDGMAERLMAMFNPESALDAGCAKGILVGSFVERGVDAFGVDISPTAIADGDPRAEGRLSVGTLAEPLGRRYDLITCIEVIEHMSQPEAEVALDNLCAATDLLVLSSSPWDLKDSTHVNVRPTGHWSAMMLDRGFVRRFDADLAFITPWAVAYQRREVVPRELVREYENEVTVLRSEVSDKRTALLEAQRQLGAQGGQSSAPRTTLPSLALGGPGADDAGRARWLEDQLRDRTLALLASRDAARGAEATAATATRQAEGLRREVERLNAELADIRSSWSWRMGRVLLLPVRLLKRLLGRPV